jgi:hypothetical protein
MYKPEKNKVGVHDVFLKIFKAKNILKVGAR